MAVAATPAQAVPILVSLMPVIIGGTIGVIGGVVGPPFVHLLQQKAEKKKKLAAKFEELIEALFEYEHWLDVIKNIRVFGYKDDQPPSPFARVHAIAAVYFPQFEKSFSELVKNDSLARFMNLEKATWTLTCLIEEISQFVGRATSLR